MLLVDQVMDLTRWALRLPGRIERILYGLERLDRIGDLADSLAALSTVELTLVRIAALHDDVHRLADSASALPDLTARAAALPDLSVHAASLAELAEHAAALPELAETAALLPDLVEQLTRSAEGLGQAVDPISRIAGRLPGRRARAAAL